MNRMPCTRVEEMYGGSEKNFHPSRWDTALIPMGTRPPVPHCTLIGTGTNDKGLLSCGSTRAKWATFVALLSLALIVLGESLLPAQEAGLYLPDEDQPILVNKSEREVRILAVLQPQAFAGSLLRRTSGYHAVVWKQGKAAGEALLASFVDDTTFHDALVSIGAIPGNNLTMAAWNERTNPESSAPDTRVEGSPVDVLVWWPGLRSPLRLQDMLIDSACLGLDMRFGGNKALIPVWRSGCIICLYSCPGGKIGNRNYTIRDYVKNPKNFSVDFSHVPKGNRKALVIVRVHSDASAAVTGRAGH